MPYSDFTIETLAQYLHLDAAQVQKLAERGQVPGRRVTGQWRFSRGEIHHWLEERIGLSDEPELARMEVALARAAARQQQEPIELAAILPREAISVPLAARTKSSVISRMTELAAEAGLIWDAAKMAEAVKAREELYPTALENGVALLHPRRPQSDLVGESCLALGITGQGIPFGGSRGELTDIFFLICAVDDRSHLRILARLSRLITDATFLSDLRHAPDARAVHELFGQREEQLAK